MDLRRTYGGPVQPPRGIRAGAGELPSGCALRGLSGKCGQIVNKHA